MKKEENLSLEEKKEWANQWTGGKFAEVLKKIKTEKEFEEFARSVLLE